MRGDIVPFLQNNNGIHINSISISSGVAMGAATYYIMKTGSDITVSAVKTGIHAGGAILVKSTAPIGYIPSEIVSICSDMTEYAADKILTTTGNTGALIGGALVGVSTMVVMMACTKIVDMIRSVPLNILQKEAECNIALKDDDDFQVLIYDIQGS